MGKFDAYEYNIAQSGERIRQLRVESGFTQEKLAAELSIDRSLLSHVEAGKRGCSVDLFVRLSNVFCVSLDLLILGKEQAVSPNMDHTALKLSITDTVERLEALKAKL